MKTHEQVKKSKSGGSIWTGAKGVNHSDGRGQVKPANGGSS